MALLHQPQVRRRLGQRLQHPPVAGAGEHDLLRLMLSDGGAQAVGQRLRRAVVIEAAIEHRAALGALSVGEVAHGGEEQHQLFLVLAQIGRLLLRLGHQDRVARGVEAVERGAVGVELVAADHHKAAQAHGFFASRRQRSEQ